MVAVVGGVVLYLRYWKGYRLQDMMYVTQGALASMQESVSTSEWQVLAREHTNGGRGCVRGAGCMAVGFCPRGLVTLSCPVAAAGWASSFVANCCMLACTLNHWPKTHTCKRAGASTLP